MNRALLRAGLPLIVVALTSAVCGCAAPLHRYPLADPLLVDPDRVHVEQKPAKYYSGMFTDSVDQTALLPMIDAEHFDPIKYKTGFPNIAFARMQDEDGAWMARILSRISDQHIRAMLDEAQLSDPAQDMELYRILIARRDKILDHYLTVRSPLANFETRADVSWAQVCFDDLALQAGVTDGRLVRYESRMYYGEYDEPQWTRHEYLDREVSIGLACVDLVEEGQRPAAQAPNAAPDSARRYAILDLLIYAEPGHQPIPPARLHFYDLGERGFRLVGIERPADDSPPLAR